MADKEEKSVKYVLPTVVRIRRKGGVVVQDCDVYIGRRMTMGGWNLQKSPFANPFKKNKNEPIGITIDKYREYLLSRDDLLELLPMLSGKSLGCWCKNKGHEPCHGDVIVEVFKERLMG
jgi:hypothetical protein